MANSNKKEKKYSKIPNPLPKTERERLRKNIHRNVKFSANTPPLMMIKITDLSELIELSKTAIYLNFFLATYRTQDDVDRYNKRVGTNYTLKDLKHRPTLLIGLEKESLVSGDVYDLATIKPPPEEKED